MRKSLFALAAAATLFAGAAQAQSAKLAKTMQAIDAEQGRLKQEIPDAIAKDEKSSGACHSGLGAHSLRLYNRALGYPD